ncbi:LOW QUALITY PROTEIN: inactive serine protease 39-like [Erethizon dorsatum]
MTPARPSVALGALESGQLGGLASGLGGRSWGGPASLLALPTGSQSSVPLAGTVFTVCGRPAFSRRIFGGKNAKSERWPWQASLLLHGRHICGAALRQTWVTSAAHCFQRCAFPAQGCSCWEGLQEGGYNQLSNPTKYGLQMTVNKLTVHQDYDKIHRMSRDMVLMQLHQPVEFNSHVLPVRLPGSNLKLDPSASCWITVWGMLTEDTFLPEPFQLQQWEVTRISHEHCAGHYTPFPGVEDPSAYEVKEDMLCAAESATGRSAEEANGPVGAVPLGLFLSPLLPPLHMYTGRLWGCPCLPGTRRLVPDGVAGWSAECLTPVGPGIFANISYLADWIKENKPASPEPDVALAPPQEDAPTLTSLNSQDTAKPQIFIVLLSSQIFLLQLILLRNL